MKDACRRDHLHLDYTDWAQLVWALNAYEQRLRKRARTTSNAAEIADVCMLRDRIKAERDE